MTRELNIEGIEDMRLSTLQRAARAMGLRLEFKLEPLEAEELKLCGNRGPRIGQGVPTCVLRLGHVGGHMPDESWRREIKVWE